MKKLDKNHPAYAKVQEAESRLKERIAAVEVMKEKRKITRNKKTV